MSKTIKVLPKINNIDFCGRVANEPYISPNGNVCRFSLIRNFGGGKNPVVMDFTYFKPKKGFPQFLKKGAPIIAHAYVTPQTWTDKDGVEHEEVVKVIKSIEEAQLVERTIKEGTSVPDNAGEEALEPEA